jgi:hypothetical protein
VKNIYFVGILMAAFSFSACTPQAVRVDLANACVGENDGKYITTSGYLDPSLSIYCSNTGGGPVRCGLDVIEKKGDKRVMGADIERGSGANEIEQLTSGYKDSDVKVHDNSGAIINLADKVTITGKLSVVPGSTCFMKVDKIER